MVSLRATVIDLKAGKFSHIDAGQMHLYLNYADYLNSQPVSHCSESLCRCSANVLDYRKSRETVSTPFGSATFPENWSAIR